MTRRISLAHLTAIDLPPPRLIDAAARAGFNAVGLRLIRVTDTSPGYPLMTDARAMRETQAALRDTGLAVSDIEFVRIEPDTDVPALSGFLDAGAALGAREVICAPYDPDLSRLADTLARVSERARDRGLGVSLEFFPRTLVPDLAAAVRVVTRAGPDMGILVDALHFDRSASRVADLRALPRHRLRLAHLCDAPRRARYSTEDLLHTARAERLLPGRGEIDLGSFLAALPGDVALGLEVPMAAMAVAEGPDAVLRQVIAATHACLAAMPGAEADRD